MYIEEKIRTDIFKFIFKSTFFNFSTVQIYLPDKHSTLKYNRYYMYAHIEIDVTSLVYYHEKSPPEL